MDYWVEIIEKRQVRDLESGVFHYEVTPDCRKVEWAGDAASSEGAEEAAMTHFQERHGERPRYLFTSIYTEDPNTPGPHIRGMPRGRPAHGFNR